MQCGKNCKNLSRLAKVIVKIALDHTKGVSMLVQNGFWFGTKTEKFDPASGRLTQDTEHS